MSVKHAYLIMAHADWDLLKTLVSLLDYELNDIYIHIDAKVQDESIPAIVCSRSNLYVLERRIPVEWGDISQIEAEYLLFEAAYNNSHYSYYHLLSGVDLPIKTKEHIYSFFMQNRGVKIISDFARTMIGFRILELGLIIFFPARCGATDSIGCWTELYPKAWSLLVA